MLPIQSLIVNASVPKNRKPKFELVLKIIDLNNVPLVSGTAYIKWHLPSSTAAEHRGRTPKCVIKEHKVTWDYEKTLQLRLTADKSGLLQDTEIHFEVLQEYSSGARGERIVLGNVKVNLAEYAYVDEGDDGEMGNGVTRRYLMQESKINSTLKICISMKQIDGERNFHAPPLKTAPIFGGIAGIITSEQGEPDISGHIPSISSKIARDIGEMQDMYRRTLAASWTSEMDELPADRCIEDIFSGGDGWGHHKPTNLLHVPPDTKAEDSTEEAESDKEIRAPPHRRTTSGMFSRQSHAKQKSQTHGRTQGKSNEVKMLQKAEPSGGAPEQQAMTSSSEEQKQKHHRPRNEVTDFEAREDWRSWEISAPT